MNEIPAGGSVTIASTELSAIPRMTSRQSPMVMRCGSSTVRQPLDVEQSRRDHRAYPLLVSQIEMIHRTRDVIAYRVFGQEQPLRDSGRIVSGDDEPAHLTLAWR